MPSWRESEELMINLLEAATAVATEIVKRKPFSLENRDQREAAHFLNDPWVTDNIGSSWRYRVPDAHPPLKSTYLDYGRGQFNKPEGAYRLLDRLSVASSKLVGDQSADLT